MAHLHRILWSVKGRMPSAISIGFMAAIYVLLAFGDLVPPPVKQPLLAVLALPLLYCFVMVYTYFAIATPLLAVAYLGGLFPELNPSLAPYAGSAAVPGLLAFGLGIVGEVLHSKEKKVEIGARYGAKLPGWLSIPLGLLGLVGGIRGALAGTPDTIQFVIFMLVSLAMVSFGSLELFLRSKRRPDH